MSSSIACLVELLVVNKQQRHHLHIAPHCTAPHRITLHCKLCWSDFGGYYAGYAGDSPYWAGCDYPIYTSFLVIDGIAFMLSVASVIVVTAFPLVLKRTPQQAAWWGGILLLLSMIAFVAAFLLSGFVTVAYKAPNPGCASLGCSEGGIECSTFAFPDFAEYELDPNVAVLNKLITADADSYAFCLRYNRSEAVDAETVMLYPTTLSCPGDNYEDLDKCQAGVMRQLNELLDDRDVQRQVVCGTFASFHSHFQSHYALHYFSSDTSISDWSFPVNWHMLSLDFGYVFANLTEFYWAGGDITQVLNLTNGNGNQTANLVPYAEMTYQCQSNAVIDDASKFDVLCEVLPRLSVSKTGEYITTATASTVGAIVFQADRISSQVAITVEVLSGVFGLVLLIIVGFLLKSKLK